jgi:hypothetical protein
VAVPYTAVQLLSPTGNIALNGGDSGWVSQNFTYAGAFGSVPGRGNALTVILAEGGDDGSVYIIPTK